MYYRRFSLLVGVLAVLFSIASCTNSGKDAAELFTSTAVTVSPESNANVPGYYGGVVTWEEDDPQLVDVLVSPQPELTLGHGKMTLSLGLIPFSTPQDHGTARGTSDLAQGAEFYTARLVTESEVLGYTFSPGTGEPAYACYELKAPLDTPHTVGIAWHSLPEDMDSYFVGIGDQAMNTWHWYAGPNDGVLTFDPTLWRVPGEIAETVYACVVLEDGKPADFWKLRWGVSETRGTGLAGIGVPRETVAVWEPDKVASTALPDTASLKQFLPPVSSQGAMGSCTAFAVNDAAFNIELAQLYSEYGWNVASDQFRMSPMWCYVKSGYPPFGDWDPPCGTTERYLTEAFEVLEDAGSPTEEQAPYYTTSNCTNSFPVEAQLQAQLLRIDEWFEVSGRKSEIVGNIKYQLAEEQRGVVIIMTRLEAALLSYQGGVYHFGGTSGSNVNHAMCITGYRDDLQAFEVRNSWGAGWGLDGYWYCGYDAVEELYATGTRLKLYSLSASFNPAVPSYFLGAAPEYSEHEPNDGLAVAQQLPGFDFEQFVGHLGDGDDAVDCYEFQFKSGRLVEFNLSYNTSATDLSMELFHSEGELIATAQAVEGGQALAGYWGSNGLARLKVTCNSGEADYILQGTSIQPPPQPRQVITTRGEYRDRIAVSWEEVPDCGYIIYRSESPDGPFAEITPLYFNKYRDDDVAALKEYWYQVKAINEESASISSYPIAGYRGVEAPQGVSASNGGTEGYVLIEWDSQDHDFPFAVKRSQIQAGPYSTLGLIQDTRLKDFSVEPNTRYYYSICAANGNLEGDRSEIVAGSLAMDPLQPADAAEETSVEPEVVPNQDVQGDGNHTVTDGNDQTVTY